MSHGCTRKQNSREFFSHPFLELFPDFWETKRLWIKLCTIFLGDFQIDILPTVLMNSQKQQIVLLLGGGGCHKCTKKVEKGLRHDEPLPHYLNRT